MLKLSRYFIFFVLCTLYFVLLPTVTPAQEAFPKIQLPCDKTKDIEFHSLRPYQAATCGDADKALYCSNDLIFIETFNVKGKGDCTQRGYADTFICHPDYDVQPHTLYVELSESMFPIMGNTEKVKNSQNSGDEFDDATKVNEYASWYLSGVTNKAENPIPTDEQIVNFSGPVNKLLPKMIQEAQRIKTIDNAKNTDTYKDDETGKDTKESTNHNQVVACAEKKWWFFGPVTPVPCYGGGSYRLLDWDKAGLGIARDSTVAMGAFLKVFPSITANIVGEAIASAWNNRKPPLPWDNGTGKPFESQIKYQKAYNEWKGKTCAIIPVFNFLICIDLDPTNIFVNSEWSEMYQYIPLSNTTDKKGAEMVTDVQGRGVGATEIGPFNYGEVKTPPLYFAHTQEVKELSEILNSTYTPLECTTTNGKTDCNPLKSKEMQTTEKNYCSVVNVRTNPGDNLFPGDPNELQVPDVHYTITDAQCVETFEPGTPSGCGPKDTNPCPPKHNLTCEAQVYITIKSVTKTPWAKEIFSTTVADSGSTFRKIFPKVEEGAPVSCIADIQTVTDVTYTDSNTLQGGSSEFKVRRYPEDGAGNNPQLTFPHIGSIYEYFLKGIQTALRPKGYGDPILNGKYCGLGNETCTSTIDEVAKAYQIPACQLMGIMELETNMGKNMGTESCNTKNGTFNCCHGNACGPAQILCSQYDAFAGDEKLDLCNPVCSSELLARAMLLKLCQADGKCNSYDWKKWGEFVIDNYHVEGGGTVADGSYTAACYFYGQSNGCSPTGCTQYRWGPGISYGDRVEAYCKGKTIPDNTSPEFCELCNQEIVRAGQNPIQCTP